MNGKKGIIIKKDEKSPEGELKEFIGKKIQYIRGRHGITAEKLAKSLGITREALTQIETGRNNINANLLWKIACRLRCEIRDFFPVIVSGFELTKTDLDSLKEFDKNAPQWAKKMFN